MQYCLKIIDKVSILFFGIKNEQTKGEYNTRLKNTIIIDYPLINTLHPGVCPLMHKRRT